MTGQEPANLSTEEQRKSIRKSCFQTISFSFEHLEQGKSTKTFALGLLTDISPDGAGLLTYRTLLKGQSLNFTNGAQKSSGRVVWINEVDEMTSKVGVCFFDQSH